MSSIKNFLKSSNYLNHIWKDHNHHFRTEFRNEQKQNHFLGRKSRAQAFGVYLMQFASEMKCNKLMIHLWRLGQSRVFGLTLSPYARVKICEFKFLKHSHLVMHLWILWVEFRFSLAINQNVASIFHWFQNQFRVFHHQKLKRDMEINSSL